ncbi:MAG: alcohol dehydrogenase catalytic domain-containing protein [Oscillospiraceae bacterium]|nr:alcohol dehydrogenase catalytic domain-containing protein [Oscillospiraceae bacterium]
MNTTAVRLYGKDDLRLETFELPPIRDDEILAKVICDSICMSSYKAAKQGAAHKRVPDDIADRPVMIGHEFCGEIVAVGDAVPGVPHPDGTRRKFKSGDKFAIQPSLTDPADVHAAPGYSFPYIGGAATYIVIPSVVMERDCLLPYQGLAFYHGSLAEPMSCVVGGFRCMYHSQAGSYVHEMGIKSGGKAIIFAGCGPMGLGAIDYALHSDRRPSLLVVTDIDQSRLDRAAALFPPEYAKTRGVELIYLNAPTPETLLKLSTIHCQLSTGYDDVFVYAPVPALIEQGGAVLGFDGCLNFFAGPTDSAFSAKLNFYDVHYNAHHLAANSGGNTDDLKESLELMAAGTIDPSAMITHVGGLDAVIDATLNLPSIPGGKKLIYTHLTMPLTEIDGIWTPERERELLERGRLA